MKKKIRVWFNHWFSAAYHIINMIRIDEEFEFVVIGSSENPNSVIRLVCDEWHIEPKFEDESEYASYCLDFCIKNKIDVFVPRRGMKAVAYNYSQFEAASVKVLVESEFEKLYTLNDKERTYKLFEQHGIGNVPERHIVDNLKDFIAAYDAVTSRFDRACIKFAIDEGATSFRVIDNSMHGLGGLYRTPGRKISLEDALGIFDNQSEIPKLMVMPYLNGIEVSMDCLSTASGIIAVPRTKIDTRTQRIFYEDEFLELCESFYSKIGISGPCNIQLKYHEDKPYLLEVNTRMSGGIQYSCHATGVNIPNLAVNQLLGVDKQWKLERKPQMVSFIETPLVL